MSIVGNLRLRYVFGLSAIAILVTTSFFAMQHLISKQRDFSQLINLAGHQAGLTNRIAYFASLMAATNDETEFNQARSQVGLTIHKMQAAHKALREGDSENRIPKVTNDALETIYKDPMMGLDSALQRFLERARQVYETDNCVRDTDTVARLGGDEFVVLLECLDSDEAISNDKAMAVAEKIRSELNRPYILGDDRHVHHTSASVGVAIFHGRDRDAIEVLKHADVAMYEAKDLGRNRICFYSKARQAIVDTRSAMALDMQIGLDNGEFCLYLQPQVLANGLLCGAEALLRWQPRDKSPVSPEFFIPVTESAGLILPLGEWVLKQACTIVMDLEKYQLPENFALAVNISALQFAEEKFIQTVKRVFQETGATPFRLKFELTETCLVQDMNRAGIVMKELRSMGLQIELDDFGTGYSSLNSIKNLPLTALKIDASLIRGIEKDETGRAMARAMSLQTIAEGVETQSQMDYLSAEGCDMIQGYLFAKPMPYEDFISYLGRKVKTA
ncbi:EAL domain-containing protein [Desulfobacter curvatus]|uniref:EAL domain-containing protein n=1 Tax=Desulfobacter curvatus TaxID=2290 RepID=UPI0003A03718|nr:EAL domain-containing protein [Desulfobacter curvatus]